MSDSAESDTQVGAEAAGMSVSPESDIPASAEASGPNPPNPSVPWNCAQPASGMNDAAQDGCDDPRITGTCWSPNRSSTYCVLRTAFPIATLPYVPTTPSRLTSSKVARYAKAKASSMPVSTSRISLRSFMGEHAVLSRVFQACSAYSARRRMSLPTSGIRRWRDPWPVEPRESPCRVNRCRRPPARGSRNTPAHLRCRSCRTRTNRP